MTRKHLSRLAFLVLQACSSARPDGAVTTVARPGATGSATPEPRASASTGTQAPVPEVDPTIAAAPDRFAADGDLGEWRGRAPQAKTAAVRLFVGSRDGGVAIALKADNPGAAHSTGEGGACALKVRWGSPAPKLPALAIEHWYGSDSYEDETSCSRDEKRSASWVKQCQDWRERQLARRKAILAEFARDIVLPCTPGAEGIEAFAPFTELPSLSQADLSSLEWELPDAGISVATTMAVPAKLAPAGSLLEWYLQHKEFTELHSSAIVVWNPRDKDKVTFYYGADEGPPKSESPESLVVDLSKRTVLKRFGDVVIEQIDRAEPPWAGAERARIVVSTKGKVTSVIPVGKQRRFALLERKEGVDLVFAFAGNSTPTSAHEYNVGEAYAVHVGADGVAGDPYWTFAGEAPLDPAGSMVCRFERATLSKDGHHVSLTGTKTCRMSADFDDAKQAWVEKPMPEYAPLHAVRTH